MAVEIVAYILQALENAGAVTSMPQRDCATIPCVKLVRSKCWASGGEISAEEVVMGELFQPTHLLVLGVIVFLLFGAKRLPELGKGLGEGLKGFKDGIKSGNDSAPPPPAPPVQQQSTTSQPPSVTAVEQK